MMEEAKGIETSSDEEETSRMEENKDMEVGDIGLSYSMDEDEDDNDNDNDNDNPNHDYDYDYDYDYDDNEEDEDEDNDDDDDDDDYYASNNEPSSCTTFKADPDPYHRYHRDPVMLKLYTRLKCVRCKLICPPPLQQCTSGHLICRTCWLELKKSKKATCPSPNCSANVRIALNNAALTKLCKSVVVPCPYHAVCGTTVAHKNLERHLLPCRLKRTGKSNWDFKTIESDRVEPSNAGKVALWLLEREILCHSCGEVAPPPIRQCVSGHVLCSQCLERMLGADSPCCPFCPKGLEFSLGTIGRNLHLEQIATDASIGRNTTRIPPVTCRFHGCGRTMPYADLASHQKECECRPIVCTTCAGSESGSVRKVAAATADVHKYLSWDTLCAHYAKAHLPHSKPTPLSDLRLTGENVSFMLDGRKGQARYLSWGHSLDDKGRTSRLFPGMYYSRDRETFYFTVRYMGPLLPDKSSNTCNDSEKVDTMPPLLGLTVTSATNLVMIKGEVPVISYRTGHRRTIDMPCLAISRATMSLMNSGGGGIRFAVEIPEDTAARLELTFT